MKRIRTARIWALPFLFAGCGPGAALEAPPQVTTAPQVRYSAPAEPARPALAASAKISAETEGDRRFAEFVRDNSAGLVSDVAVTIERSARMQVVLTDLTAPEDTLPLTKGLMDGARKDFPDRPFTLTVFDPSKAPILKARFDPGQGVSYQLVQDAAAADAPAAPATGPIANRSATEKDRRFADWAMDKGRDYLRYVEADLDRNGRLWFGITSKIEPDEVPELTKSLLEGARAEFPRRELTATVFDPEGEKIGKASLDADGQVNWSR